MCNPREIVWVLFPLSEVCWFSAFYISNEGEKWYVEEKPTTILISISEFTKLFCL